ncbi:MAG: V-type ATP synthase subunit I [Clostridiales bacterium]|nr:V-type ATP synthase subunit I [Clostridiales bacterium]
MSIASMKKLSVIGLASEKKALMKSLMRLGVVEITTQEGKMTDEEWSRLVSLDGNESAVSEYDSRLLTIEQALDAFSKYGTEKKPLFQTRKPVKRNDFEQKLKEKEEIEAEAKKIASLSARILELNTEANKVEANKLSLLPWKDYDIPLEVQGTKETEIAMGVVPSVSDVKEFEKDLKEKTERCLVELVNSDAEQHYLFVLYLKGERDEIEDVLKLYGFTRTTFSDLQGSVASNIEAFDKKLSAIAEEKERVIEEIQSRQGSREDVEYLHDSLIIERDQAAIRSRLLLTKKSFYLDGWVPRIALDEVEKLLKDHGCYYEIESPSKDEETPILLLNSRFNSPFESITKLYALPNSKEIDATPFFALSYAIFFGMMLSDAAYGLIITVATFTVMKKFRLEGMAKQLVNMFLYCGISTIFWGVMFGGFFGDMVSVIAKTFFNSDIVFKPLWFEPMQDPMKLLYFSLLLGGIHIFIGMALNAYLSIRDGRLLDAVFDVGLWYLLLIGLALMLVGVAAPLAKWMSIIGAVGILLTGGRHKKGLGKVIGGFTSLYGITGYLADILSYSRLLALGLATGVIAAVVNTMGSLAGGGLKGLILFIIVFIIGHTYNMLINTLGSFVHSSRLEYVEFFGKFYEGGGEAFDPYSEKTKYIEILREDK